jgi:hypothetical protein
VKDLVDIVLIAEGMIVSGPALLAALRATFSAQGSGEPPVRFPDPPSGWAAEYRRLAEEIGLSATTLPVAIAAARRFLEPVLQGVASGAWSPATQEWR